MIHGLLAVIGVFLLVAAPSAGAEEARLHYWAMAAHTEGRQEVYLDPGLEAVGEAVKGLKHDTYTSLKIGTHTFTESREFGEKLTPAYTLKASAPEKAQGGRYRMKVRITLTEAGKDPHEIDALETDLLIQPEKKVLVRGLELADGQDLIVVLSLSAEAHSETR